LHRVGNGKPQCLRGLELDHEFELTRLHDRVISISYPCWQFRGGHRRLSRRPALFSQSRYGRVTDCRPRLVLWHECGLTSSEMPPTTRLPRERLAALITASIWSNVTLRRCADIGHGLPASRRANASFHLKCREFRFAGGCARALGSRRDFSLDTQRGTGRLLVALGTPPLQHRPGVRRDACSHRICGGPKSPARLVTLVEGLTALGPITEASSPYDKTEGRI
jgi:hypothetical protein